MSKFPQKSTKIVPKIHQNGSQNRPKFVPNSSLGGLLGGSCCMFCFLLFFSSLFSPSGQHFGANLAPSWSQVGPSWEQVGPSWGQDAPCWRQVGPSWCQSRPSSRQNGPNMGFQRRSQRMLKFVSIFQPILYRFFIVF